MDKILDGSIIKSFEILGREKEVSFSFPLKGYTKFESAIMLAKSMYEKSFIKDFYNIFTSKIE